MSDDQVVRLFSGLRDAQKLQLLVLPVVVILIACLSWLLLR